MATLIEPLTRHHLRGMHKNLQDVALAARDLGWMAERQPSGSVRMYAPTDGVSFLIPMSKRNGRAASGLRRRLHHWQDAQPTTPQEETVTTEAIPDGITPETQPETSQPATQRYVVSVEPLIVRSPNGEVYYTSTRMNERVWSDGSKDYLCSLCGEARESARGVAAHWQRKDHRRTAETTPERVTADGIPMTRQEVRANTGSRLRKMREEREQRERETEIPQAVIEKILAMLGEQRGDDPALATVTEQRDKALTDKAALLDIVESLRDILDETLRLHRGEQ